MEWPPGAKGRSEHGRRSSFPRHGASDGFDILLDGHRVLRHRIDAPAFYVGHGRPLVEMYRGNFAIEDRIDARLPLSHARILRDADGCRIALSAAPDGPALIDLSVMGTTIAIAAAADGLNRLWLRLPATPGEHCWGGGEQMSYVDLRGRRFPLWTSEPGVGRDKASYLTFQADVDGKAGGDYWNTNYPQPTFLSSRRYAVHLDTTVYCAFDFRDPDFHELEVWEIPARIEWFTADTLAALVSRLSLRFGRQPRLPDWAFSGAIVGLKDGANSFARLDTLLDAGAVVSGLWCEDWVGLRETSFGKRLFWDWQANEDRYPALRQHIAALHDRGIRFLGYINPYLAVDGSLYRDAADAGYLARRVDSDAIYHVDFGGFDCGIVDFTLPAAADWFAEVVIGRNMLDYGLSGWMADFGEYLPVDVRLANGVDGMRMHNAWPTIWAKVNADGIARRGRTGDALFFMRAGWTGVGAYCPLLWAGDQSVDFSRHDGIGTVLRGALSSGLVGNAYHHGDLGGYTSLFGNVRTPDLLMRWSELSAFPPVMRSHEGNRPANNLQLDGDPVVLRHFVRMTRIHARLAPYVATLCDQAVATGLPLQRPLFLDHESDPRTHGIETQYLYGPDLLVAPVLAADRDGWSAYLPTGTDWIHVWSGTIHAGGQDVTVPAPIGKPPIFYRPDSPFAALFRDLRIIPD